MDNYLEIVKEIRNNLTIDQVYAFVDFLDGEPRYEKNKTDCFISRTICHNVAGLGNHKLYYYDNTKLFKCYSECSDTFDIYTLFQKVVEIRDGIKINMAAAVKYVASYFGITLNFSSQEENTQVELEDWAIFKRYNNCVEHVDKIIELNKFNPNILKYFPSPCIEPWLKDGITKEICDEYGIKFNPVNDSILIPHYNAEGELIGIRERTLVKENESKGKYRPAYINGKLYNHPLGFNLYNLNNSKDNIRMFKTAIVFEGEKGALQYASFFGKENDISVAVCGSSLLNYQVDLLLQNGAEEIVIAFDKQFKKLGDEEHNKWSKKLLDINLKYSKKCKISFIFDKGEILDYKMSPADKGKEVFLQLFRERIII